LVLKEGKIYILRNEELRLEIIQLHYNILIAVLWNARTLIIFILFYFIFMILY